MLRSNRRRVLLFLSFVVLATSAPAWGPHTQITLTALQCLGTNQPLRQILGAQFQHLTNYCWLADYKRLPFPETDVDFYADDYLLFPGITNHFDHICPEVKKTYRPYFQRALQALRTENPANAARWIGSLLHFVQDTGSPPHAGEIRGPVHIKMENWVDANQIVLRDYQPRLLGTNDDAALQGFLARMDELIVFLRERAHRARLGVEIGHRAAVLPIVLESALETARVTADLLHTLGHLSLQPSTNDCVLRGVVKAQPGVAMERFPARVLLANTPYATLTDGAGRYEFRGLPPGEMQIIALRPGAAVQRSVVQLKPGVVNEGDLSLSGTNAPANLLRNGDFSVRWQRPDAPDCWTPTELGWEGEIVPLKKGQRYELRVDFKKGAAGDVLIRWTRQLPYQVPNAATMPKINSRPLTPEDNLLVFEGSDSMALLQLTLRSRAKPYEVCDQLVLKAAGENLR